jgi:hypothetical protein
MMAKYSSKRSHWLLTARLAAQARQRAALQEEERGDGKEARETRTNIRRAFGWTVPIAGVLRYRTWPKRSRWYVTVGSERGGDFKGDTLAIDASCK